jgi:hypothetical protein
VAGFGESVSVIVQNAGQVNVAADGEPQVKTQEKRMARKNLCWPSEIHENALSR